MDQERRDGQQGFARATATVSGRKTGLVDHYLPVPKNMHGQRVWLNKKVHKLLTNRSRGVRQPCASASAFDFSALLASYQC
jgi:hypothetical protein